MTLDCIGYIWRWGEALYDDRNNPLSGTNKAAEERIKKGLWGALGASTLGYYKLVLVGIDPEKAF